MRDALNTLDAQSLRISKELGTIGAFISRLGCGLRTLAAARENFEQAASRIKDADIASESARYVAANIRQQIASWLLAQANQIPNLAVTLLRG